MNFFKFQIWYGQILRNLNFHSPKTINVEGIFKISTTFCVTNLIFTGFLFFININLPKFLFIKSLHHTAILNFCAISAWCVKKQNIAGLCQQTCYFCSVDVVSWSCFASCWIGAKIQILQNSCMMKWFFETELREIYLYLKILTVFYSAEIEDQVSNLVQTLLIFLAQISKATECCWKYF